MASERTTAIKKATAHQEEVREGENRHQHAANQVPAAVSETVREVTKEWNGDHLQNRANRDGVKDKRLIQGQLLQAVGDGKGCKEIEGRLLDEAGARAQQDFGCAVAEGLNKWSLGFTLLLFELREKWGLQHAQADIEANDDQERADEEGDAPAPGEEILPSGGLHDVGYDSGEDQAKRVPIWGQLAQKPLRSL